MAAWSAFGGSQSEITSVRLESSNQRAGISLPGGNFSLGYKQGMTGSRYRDRTRYGGRNETFQVALITPPAALVYRSQRGRTSLTWSLVLEPADSEPGRTRVFLRLRMAPVRHKLLARTAGELIDLLTVAGMAAGLAERLRGHDEAQCYEAPGRSTDTS